MCPKQQMYPKITQPYMRRMDQIVPSTPFLIKIPSSGTGHVGHQSLQKRGVRAFNNNFLGKDFFPTKKMTQPPPEK